MRRRKPLRSYGSSSRNRKKVNFTPIIIILCLSVGCGYATAKYVVDPVVNYVPQLMAEKEQQQQKEQQERKAQKNGTTVLEDEVDVKEDRKVSGYALQFGSYSGKASAESVIPSIGVTDLKVIHQDGMYKIIGEVYKTKDEAKTALGNLPEDTKAFITTIYE